MLKEKVKTFGEQLGVKDFTYSNGWLNRFKKRHGTALQNVHGESAAADDVVEVTKGLFYRLELDATLAPGPINGKKKNKEQITEMAFPFENRRFGNDKALRLLQACAEDQSMDEEDSIVDQLQVTYPSDSDADEEAIDQTSSSSDTVDDSVSRVWSTHAGVQWTNITGNYRRGRASAVNVFRQKCEPTSYAIESIEAEKPITAIRLFIDEPTVCYVPYESTQKFTAKRPVPVLP
ncbi:unnamed protein product [Clavelina lepadiformis]|uniref:HTH CENPB-type domain-containing protein n=1 Tax=Clavelina lepadiformis TaxID=159417 RepID=A0ABP0GX61_CLALP